MNVRWTLLVWMAAAFPAAASTFNISPIRAELSENHRTAVLTLTNADDQPVVVQVHVLAWSQENSEEHQEETREVLVTPPVLQIPAMHEQIVRIALRRDPDAQRELTYRVIFEEVPQAAPANFTGLRVALRLSVPIFIAPAHARAAPYVSWEAHRLANGDIEVAATNRGTGHLQISDFDLQWHATGTRQSPDGELHSMAPKYVLPGSRMIWTLKPSPAATPVRSAAGVVHGHSDAGEFSADVVLSGS